MNRPTGWIWWLIPILLSLHWILSYVWWKYEQTWGKVEMGKVEMGRTECQSKS